MLPAARLAARGRWRLAHALINPVPHPGLHRGRGGGRRLRRSVPRSLARSPPPSPPRRDVSAVPAVEAAARGGERRARWRVPVVPATREAEPAGSLEPRSSGLQCAMPSGRPR
uniref:Uncharacterized protein n=1 Tax=Aquila chrysaetos chrysaetos TaxID=223781 RepID=A0A663DRL9_AQUCH